MIENSQTHYEVSFFGKNTLIDDLKKENRKLFQLRQWHSDKLVLADQASPDADAHWTDQKQQILLIQTADCLPVMIYLPTLNSVLAIHAGWRGVEQKIVSKSLISLGLSKKDSVHVHIGPHIQKKSFEVHEDVALKILKAHDLNLESEYCHVAHSKYHLDLAALVIREIESLEIQIKMLFKSELDTKTDSRFYSYRCGDRGGRNFSTIYLK